MLDIQLSKLYVDKKAVWKVVFNQLTTFYATISCMNSCMALPRYLISKNVAEPDLVSKLYIWLYVFLHTTEQVVCFLVVCFVVFGCMFLNTTFSYNSKKYN